EPLIADQDDVASGRREGEGTRSNPAASSLDAVVEEEATQVALPRLATLVEHVLQPPTGRLGEIREDRLTAGIRQAAMRAPDGKGDDEAVTALPEPDVKRLLVRETSPTRLGLDPLQSEDE